MESNKNNYLGLYQFDLQYIYNNFPDHTMHNNWIGLYNYENKAIDGINGYLRLSINVSHELDKKIPLTVKNCDLSAKNLIAPSTSTSTLKFQQLSFFIYCVHDIPEMDSGKNDFEEFVIRKDCKSDTYVQIDYMDLKVQTKIKKTSGENYSLFCEILKIPIIEPRLSNKILIKIIDDDDVTSDDLIGTIELNLDEILDDNSYFHQKNDINISSQNQNEKNRTYYVRNFRNLKKDDIRILKKNDYDANDYSLFDFENNLKNEFNFIKNKNVFEMLSKKASYDKIGVYPIYGSNPSFDGNEMGLLMNTNSEIGHMYKGSLVMKIVKEVPKERPIITCEPFTPLETEIFSDRKCSWRLYFELYDLNLFRVVDINKIKVTFSCGKESKTLDVFNIL